MKIKHIYWFAPYQLTCPSTRYRGLYPLSHLKEFHGIENDFIAPIWSLSNIANFIKIYIEILFFRKKNSIIVIQKVVSNRLYANALKLLVLIQNKATVFDFDDAEYLRNDTKTLHFFLKNCQFISVGSTALKEYSLKFNQNIFIQTSPVISHNWQKKEKNSVFTIGWVGDFGNGNEITKPFSHKSSLYTLLFPALVELNFPIKFCLIGIKNQADIPEIQSYFSSFPNISIEIPTNLDWKEDSWLYKLIAQWDIGVSPILSHPFNEAKSAFKAKQYLSCGVPAIASPIGENEQFVQDRQNGLICRNAVDFGKAIQFFYKMNNDEYAFFSKNALENKAFFSIENYCKGLVEYFDKN